MGMQYTLPIQSWTDLQSKKHDAVLTVISTLDCYNCYHMNWPCYCQCSNLRCWYLGMLTHCLLAFYAFTSQYDSNCSTHTKNCSQFESKSVLTAVSYLLYYIKFHACSIQPHCQYYAYPFHNKNELYVMTLWDNAQQGNRHVFHCTKPSLEVKRPCLLAHWCQSYIFTTHHIYLCHGMVNVAYAGGPICKAVTLKLVWTTE
jgi:hypothetical protein